MNLHSLLTDKKFLPAWIVLALLLAACGAGLRYGAGEKRAAAESLSASCEVLEGMQPVPAEEKAGPFLESLLGPGDAGNLAGELEAAGLSISSVSEGEGAEKNFHTIRLMGTGTFPQILSAFDIIGNKEEWNGVDLLSLRRQGSALSFEMEVAAFPRRGTYEKEKYRPHRTHGDREEPGGEDHR